MSFCIFLLSYFSLIACTPCGKPAISYDNDSIVAITISRNFPWMNNNGKLLSYEPENASIFFKKDLILFKIPYEHKIFKLSNGNYEVDKIEIRTKYFIYQKGYQAGYFTDSSLNLFFLECPVDSVITQFWPKQPIMDSLLKKSNYGVIDSLTKRTGKCSYNTYFFQNKTDSLQKGTFTLEFTDGLPFFDYSLSQRLDTVQKMKLTGITIMNEARYVKEYNITIDAVTQNRNLTQLHDFNLAEIAPYFKYLESELLKKKGEIILI